MSLYLMLYRGETTRDWLELASPLIVNALIGDAVIVLFLIDVRECSMPPSASAATHQRHHPPAPPSASAAIRQRRHPPAVVVSTTTDCLHVCAFGSRAHLPVHSLGARTCSSVGASSRRTSAPSQR